MAPPQGTTNHAVRDSIATWIEMAGYSPVWLYDVANPPQDEFPFVGLHMLDVRTAEQPELFHDDAGMQSSRILHVGQCRVGCYSRKQAGAGAALDIMDDLLGVLEFLSVREMFTAAGIGVMGRERIVHNPYREKDEVTDRCTIEIYFSWCTVRTEDVGYISTVERTANPIFDVVVTPPVVPPGGGGGSGGEGPL